MDSVVIQAIDSDPEYDDMEDEQQRRAEREDDIDSDATTTTDDGTPHSLSPKRTREEMEALTKDVAGPLALDNSLGWLVPGSVPTMKRDASWT